MAYLDFQRFARSKGINISIEVSSVSTHTALDAANFHGVTVSSIVKSILIKVDDKYNLYLVPGDQMLDLDFIKNKLKANSVLMASADEVKSVTGYSIGGVPPFGHKSLIDTYFWHGFDTNSYVIAAAGASNATFKISYKYLKEILKDLGTLRCL